MALLDKGNSELPILDPLDLPGELEKAKIHGRAQKILNLDNFDPKGSNIFLNKKTLNIAIAVSCLRKQKEYLVHITSV
jgi:hypothetical protein